MDGEFPGVPLEEVLPMSIINTKDFWHLSSLCSRVHENDLHNS